MDALYSQFAALYHFYAMLPTAAQVECVRRLKDQVKKRCISEKEHFRVRQCFSAVVSSTHPSESFKSLDVPVNLLPQSNHSYFPTSLRERSVLSNETLRAQCCWQCRLQLGMWLLPKARKGPTLCLWLKLGSCWRHSGVKQTSVAALSSLLFPHITHL